MDFLLILNILIGLLFLFSIIREVSGQLKLGKRLGKAKSGIAAYRILLLLHVAVICWQVFMLVKEYRSFDPSNVKLILHINLILFFVLSLVRLMRTGELREKGIITSRGYVLYHNIQTVKWVKENKLEIKFNENVFSWLTKENWRITDNQKDHINQILEEKHQYIIST